MNFWQLNPAYVRKYLCWNESIARMGLDRVEKFREDCKRNNIEMELEMWLLARKCSCVHSRVWNVQNGEEKKMCFFSWATRRMFVPLARDTLNMLQCYCYMYIIRFGEQDVNFLVQPVRITPSQTAIIYLLRAHTHSHTRIQIVRIQSKTNQRPFAVCTKWRLKKEKTDFRFIFVGGNSLLTTRWRWRWRWRWRRLCILGPFTAFFFLISIWNVVGCVRAIFYVHFSCDFITHMHHTVRHFNFISL